MQQKTQLHYARKGIITDHMQEVAKSEMIKAEFVRDEIAKGRLIIPANINHKNLKPIGVGETLTCKINANIRNSAISSNKEDFMPIIIDPYKEKPKLSPIIATVFIPWTNSS